MGQEVMGKDRLNHLGSAQGARSHDGKERAAESEESMKTVDRRTFLQASAGGLAGAALFSGPSLAATPEKSSAPWYRNAYRRNVIDMHITDWNEEFLSQFDPDEYVRILKLSQVQSAVVYAHSHVGLCNFPTKVGQTHRGMQGKDHLARVIEQCHKHDISVVLYSSVIHDRWAFDNHPDWRIMLASGRPTGHQTRPRFGLCCPNSPYRDYIAALAKEICDGYDFEGIRFDMTYWPTVCYCRHCRNRFASEVGGKLPTIINWEDPRWTKFQRRREVWLTEFAKLLTSTVKAIKPHASVEHQASGYPGNWVRGVDETLAAQNDFLQGDFYGDALQGSFVRKLFYNLSENLPYGFETSVMVSIPNHTAKKPVDLLRAKAYASLADGGAFIFIDAIDPVGTLNQTVYEHMAKIFDETKAYEPYFGGRLCQDVAIYLSTWSKCDFSDNGKSVDDQLSRFLERHPSLSKKMPHVDAAVSVCKACRNHHLPFGVITKRNLGDLARHRVLVLPNVLMMDEEEADAVREYVRNGGTLYASKYTSLITKEGERLKDFRLADVFGVSYVGETKEQYTYIAPTDDAKQLFAGYSPKYPLGVDAAQLKIKAHAGSRVLGTLTLPYTDPADMDRFASIHSNPPGIATDHPAVVMNQFGKGKAVYVAGELENSDLYLDTVAGLIGMLSGEFCFEVQAPSSVEVTLFDQEEKNRYLINLVSFQKELPNIPVEGITVKVKTEGKKVARLISLPDETNLDYASKNGWTSFAVPRLENFVMLAMDFAG